MEMTHKTIGEIDILELNGRFDAYEVPIFVKWFEENQLAYQVVVNLSGVGFIDSSGLATLVKGLKICRQNKGDMHLSSLQQAVLIIFELTRMDKAFNIFEDEQSAVAAFSA